MRLLLINPNTNAAITSLLLREAQKSAAPETTLSTATGRFGGQYIASRATYAIAAHAALDAYAAHGADADVVALACFGDPGLFALKELAHQCVIGMAEAACEAAAMDGRRFGIVTGGERWGPMLQEFVASIGLSEFLTGVTTVAPTGADIARDPLGSIDILARACDATARGGANVVILGGAGLAGLTDQVRARTDVPIIDALSVLIKRAEALAANPPARNTKFTRAAAIESHGLAPGLEKLLAGRGEPNISANR